MPLTSKGFPLFLTFDLDAETMWTGRDAAYASRPILMSQGAYGWKVGSGRVLDLLDRYGIKTTFFVPGLIIDQREALMEKILRRGHELAHHSYSHTWILNLTPEQEREEMLWDLVTLFECLEERHSALLTLRYLSGFSTSECAKRLGYNASSVRKLSCRALAKMLRRMDLAEAGLLSINSLL